MTYSSYNIYQSLNFIKQSFIAFNCEMSKILTEISAGELLDKISILEIKLSKIKNNDLLKEVKKEY